jgi:uncharacterized membrane protein
MYNKDGTPFGTTLTNSSGSYNSFIVKYNSAGFVQWTAKQSATGENYSYGVATDSAGNIIIAGYYYSTLTLYNKDGTAFGTTLVSPSYHSFIVKYNSAGFVQWTAKQAGSPTTLGYGVATDSAGNIIIVGQTSSTALTLYNKDDTIGTTLSNSGIASFIVKYNSAGFVQWAAKQGGSASTYPLTITADSTGNIIIGGYFSGGTTIFYNSDGTDTTPNGIDSIVFYR